MWKSYGGKEEAQLTDQEAESLLMGPSFRHRVVKDETENGDKGYTPRGNECSLVSRC